MKIQSRWFSLEVSRSYVFVRMLQHAAHFGRRLEGGWFCGPYGSD